MARATFYTTGMEHSPTSATGTAWARRGARRSGRRGKHSDNARMTSHPPRVQTRGFLGRAGRERRFNIGCLIVLVLIAIWLVLMMFYIDNRVRSHSEGRSESGVRTSASR